MWQTESCHFEPFFTTITRKIKILENWKNCLEISSFYTSVPKIMIICYTVPVIWCITDVIVIFHFGLFFALLPTKCPKNQNFEWMKKKTTLRYHHFTQVYQKSWSYAIMFLRYGTWHKYLLFFILGYFLPFYCTNSPKNQN